MLNSITIMGRIAKTPELRRTTNGNAVCSFTLAVERDYKSEDGTKETDWINCIVWRNNAEYVTKWGTKGRMLCVEGRLQSREWKDKDGNKRMAWEINAERVYFGDRAEKPQELTEKPQELTEIAEDDAELPF